MLLAGGCGEGGASRGATVSAYVVAPLCGGAKQELARAAAAAAGLRVRALCLADPRRHAGVSLAAIGANARSATEDSTAVAYVEPPGSATRFSRPIVEAAGIAWIASSSGRSAMVQLLHAIAESDTGSLRESVRHSLERDGA